MDGSLVREPVPKPFPPPEVASENGACVVLFLSVSLFQCFTNQKDSF